MEKPSGFQMLIATITVTIAEKEYHASVVRQDPPDGNKYFLMAQKWHQYHPFEASGDISTISRGMAVMGELLVQELQGEQGETNE